MLLYGELSLLDAEQAILGKGDILGSIVTFVRKNGTAGLLCLLNGKVGLPHFGCSKRMLDGKKRTLQNLKFAGKVFPVPEAIPVGKSHGLFLVLVTDTDGVVFLEYPGKDLLGVVILATGNEYPHLLQGSDVDMEQFAKAAHLDRFVTQDGADHFLGDELVVLGVPDIDEQLDDFHYLSQDLFCKFTAFSVDGMQIHCRALA
jgi:hypothetical protein